MPPAALQSEDSTSHKTRTMRRTTTAPPNAGERAQAGSSPPEPPAETKTKRERLNKEATIRASQEEEQTEPENDIIIELYYEIKPMTPEDAKLKLQENKGNTFLTFVNLENGKVNVIYKLKDNKNYGLIEPEA